VTGVQTCALPIFKEIFGYHNYKMKQYHLWPGILVEACSQMNQMIQLI